jgi:hypothetical protein
MPNLSDLQNGFYGNVRYLPMNRREVYINPVYFYFYREMVCM